MQAIEFNGGRLLICENKRDETLLIDLSKRLSAYDENTSGAMRHKVQCSWLRVESVLGHKLPASMGYKRVDIFGCREDSE